MRGAKYLVIINNVGFLLVFQRRALMYMKGFQSVSSVMEDFFILMLKQLVLESYVL